MAKSLQVTVTNPDDLNTLQGELVTQNYNLEILGLKNPADFRKFSKSLMMLDRILKETNDKVDNGLKTKLNKGSYGGDADDLKREVDNKVSKAGDTMTGALILNGPNANQLTIQVNGKNVGQVIAGVDNAIGIYNITNAHYMKLNGDGTTIIHANNLHTISKEVISAINELKISTDGKEPAFSKKSGFNKDKTSVFTERDSDKLFTQEGAYNLNKELQRNIDNKVGFIRYLDGINSPEELYALAPGIYKLRNKPIFGLGEGWWTVTKGFSGSADDGDQIVKVNYSAGQGYYYQGGFSSGTWTNWHKFNACPYEVGDIYITSRKGNPAELWLKTAWEKIRGRFLYATEHDENAGVLMTGGNSTVTLTKDNLPNVKVQVEPFSLSRGSMNITGRLGYPTTEGSNFGEGAFSMSLSTGGRSAGGGGNAIKWDFDASRTWTGTTSTASPYTQALGNSKPIDIMPPFINVHMWRRTQ